MCRPSSPGSSHPGEHGGPGVGADGIAPAEAVDIMGAGSRPNVSRACRSWSNEPAHYVTYAETTARPRPPWGTACRGCETQRRPRKRCCDHTGSDAAADRRRRAGRPVPPPVRGGLASTKDARHPGRTSLTHADIDATHPPTGVVGYAGRGARSQLRRASFGAGGTARDLRGVHSEYGRGRRVGRSVVGLVAALRLVGSVAPSVRCLRGLPVGVNGLGAATMTVRSLAPVQFRAASAG